MRDSFDKLCAEEGDEVPVNLNEEMMLAFTAISSGGRAVSGWPTTAPR